MGKLYLKLFLLVVLTTLYSCKTTKNLEISAPFSEKKYKSNKNFFRVTSSGNSKDLETAKKKAIMNAKSELSGNIRSTVKAVTDQYTNSTTVENNEQFENKFEELARTVVKEILSDLDVKEEKLFRETDKKMGKDNYSVWVVLEMSRQSVFDDMNNKISKDQKLRLDYDKMKYEKIFNSEMEKLAEENN